MERHRGRLDWARPLEVTSTRPRMLSSTRQSRRAAPAAAGTIEAAAVRATASIDAEERDVPDVLHIELKKVWNGRDPARMEAVWGPKVA